MNVSISCQHLVLMMSKRSSACRRAKVDGLTIGYELIGDGPAVGDHPRRPLHKDYPGCGSWRETLADHGNQVLIWDRPNCGASDVCFDGPSESAMQADVLAGLLRHLDMAPAVIAGGSGGSRVSLLDRRRAIPTSPPPRAVVDQRRRATGS